MPSDLRFPREAWLVLLAGVAWFAAAREGWGGIALALVPGSLLVASGAATLLALGEPRLRDLGAVGGLLGVVLALPAAFSFGPGVGAVLAALSAGAFAATGAFTARTGEGADGVDQPPRTLQLNAQIALDQAVRGSMLLLIPFPRADEHARLAGELREAGEQWRARGWLAQPASYHAAPPPVERVAAARRRLLGTEYEELRFQSEYEPHAGEPGRERWLSYAPNQLAWAWLLRSPAASQRWLVCLHGYQMGMPAIDLAVFRAEQWRRRGWNVLLPVLPLHGPRRLGAVSGIGMFGADFLDSAHALAQAMWDVRRLLGWARAQGASELACYGLSLGGYSAALLATLAPELGTVIAGIPAADFPRLVWQHAPLAERMRIERAGLTRELAAPVMRPVSPLALAPLVPHARRFVFGAPDDQFVPADQVRDLLAHWGAPRHVWFPGAHISFRAHAEVQALLREALAPAEAPYSQAPRTVGASVETDLRQTSDAKSHYNREPEK
jgi:dienelactone hydrolase